MIDPEKYITFKREEILHMLPPNLYHPALGIEIKDARVIRDQDFFAASAYYAYAHHIRGMIEMLERLDYSNIPHVIVNGDQLPSLDHLNEIADYFMNAAEVAEANPNRKLPT